MRKTEYDYRYDPRGRVIKTFKVVDPRDGGVLTTVKVADNERENDEISVKEAKRRTQAERVAQAWMQNYFNNQVTIRVVEE